MTETETRHTIEAKLRAMTDGPWAISEYEGGYCYVTYPAGHAGQTLQLTLSTSNTNDHSGIVALRNHGPALLALLGEAEKLLGIWEDQWGCGCDFNPPCLKCQTLDLLARIDGPLSREGE
jgi:hypothetical protein